MKYASVNDIGDSWAALEACVLRKDGEPNLVSNDMINMLRVFIKLSHIMKINVPSPWYATLRGRNHEVDYNPPNTALSSQFLRAVKQSRSSLPNPAQKIHATRPRRNNMLPIRMKSTGKEPTIHIQGT